MAPIYEGDRKKTISTMEDWMIHSARTPHPTQESTGHERLTAFLHKNQRDSLLQGCRIHQNPSHYEQLKTFEIE
jgi:hypothetical protein